MSSDPMRNSTAGHMVIPVEEIDSEGETVQTGGAVYVTVQNYYTGIRPDFTNHRNTVRVNTEESLGVEVEVTRSQCLDLAQMFLAVANESGHW